MKEYIVTYKIGDGTKKKIVYDALTKAEAKNMAKQDGLNVVRIEESITISGLDKFLEKQFPSIVKLKNKTILDFFTQLLFMVEADINLVKAIENMKRGVKDKKYRGFLNDVYRGILQGKQLSDMLLPKYGFEPEIKMQIQSGEKSGNIATALRTIVDRMTRERGTKSKVTKQLAYPVVVILMLIGVMYYILTNVIPGLSNVLMENGGELPGITIFMINLSNAAQSYGLFFIGGLAVLILLIIYLKKREDTGYYIDKAFLKLPAFGEIIQLSSLSRYFYVASNMLEGDLPLVFALDVAAKSVSNKYLKSKLKSFPSEIRKQGTQLDVLMANFNPTSDYADLISVGLATGRLEEIFLKISQETLEQSDSKVKTLTSMMEPVITIFIGAAVALLVLSLFMPMFKLIDTIQY